MLTTFVLNLASLNTVYTFFSLLWNHMIALRRMENVCIRKQLWNINFLSYFVISYLEVAPCLEHWQISSYFIENFVLLEIEYRHTENPTNLEDHLENYSPIWVIIYIQCIRLSRGKNGLYFKGKSNVLVQQFRSLIYRVEVPATLFS